MSDRLPELETARITITMVIEEDGRERVSCDSSEGLSVVTALGMLRLIEGQILEGDDDDQW